jgi:hypothetical protein
VIPTKRETKLSLLLLAALAGALALADPGPGPGPLALCAGLLAVHAALVAPAVGDGGAIWAFAPLLLGLPALASSSYGHSGSAALGALATVALTCASGWSARTCRAHAYLPLMLLVFLAPFGLAYLVDEFGGGDPASWRAASPLGGPAGWPAPACIALLLAWPAWAFARRRRR